MKLVFANSYKGKVMNPYTVKEMTEAQQGNSIMQAQGHHTVGGEYKGSMLG